MDIIVTILILKKKFNLNKYLISFILILSKNVRYISYYTTGKYTEDIAKYMKFHNDLYGDIILELFMDEFSNDVQQSLCHFHGCLYLLDKIDYTPKNFVYLCARCLIEEFDDYIEKINYDISYIQLFKSYDVLIIERLMHLIEKGKINLNGHIKYIFNMREKYHYDFIIWCYKRYNGDKKNLLINSVLNENIKISK